MKGRTFLLAAVPMLAVSTVGFGVGLPATATDAASADAANCSALKGFKPDSWTTITNASLAVPGYSPEQGVPPLTKPICRVEAVSSPEPGSEIGFEVWLPTAGNWNGRFQGIGGGGNSGKIMYQNGALGITRGLAAAVETGFAAVSTDNGHRGASVTDQSWAVGNQPVKIVDMGFRAIHVSTVAGKAITEKFYRRKIDYSYWIGCSQGGAKGMMGVQRWPDDYDGVLAGAPMIHWTRAMASATAGALAQMRSPEAIIPKAKLPMIRGEVMRQCDAVDGLKDGIISRPDLCRFDVEKITCKAGDGATCLTRPQASGLMRTYAGERRANGERLTDPYDFGSESWPWIGQAQPDAGQNWPRFWKEVVFEDPKFDTVKSLELEKDFDYAMRKLGWAYDAENPDLTPFMRSGGKLIVFHGQADQLISAVATSAYYRDVVNTMGEQNVDRFLRYYLLPGVDHCRGGVGPDTVDLLPALQNWVEKGEPPANLTIAKFAQGKVTRTRPMCAYPRVAVYKGSGDIDDAASFTCKPRT